MRISPRAKYREIVQKRKFRPARGKEPRGHGGKRRKRLGDSGRDSRAREPARYSLFELGIHEVGRHGSALAHRRVSAVCENFSRAISSEVSVRISSSSSRDCDFRSTGRSISRSCRTHSILREEPSDPPEMRSPFVRVPKISRDGLFARSSREGIQWVASNLYFDVVSTSTTIFS